MNRVHIVGRKNHGKTTLIVELVREFVERGHFTSNEDSTFRQAPGL